MVHMNRRMRRLTLVAFALIALPALFAKKDPYEFRFGLMTVNGQGQSSVYLETTEIEKHADPSYAHGFTIKRKNGSQFFYYFRVRFPEPLKNIPPAVYDHYKVLENGRIFESQEKFVWQAMESFVFDKADPVGLYQLEIYIDGELYRKVDYNVSPVPEFNF